MRVLLAYDGSAGATEAVALAEGSPGRATRPYESSA